MTIEERLNKLEQENQELKAAIRAIDNDYVNDTELHDRLTQVYNDQPTNEDIRYTINNEIENSSVFTDRLKKELNKI